VSDELPTARSLRALFSQIAVLREYQEADDPRCADAACNLHLLAATVADVPAEVIVRLNDACERVGVAVVARQTIEIVVGVGLERGLFKDATAFYEVLIASVDGDVAPSPRLN
jgi:hypothetical protein